MDLEMRRALARRALAGYASGPDASTLATTRAVERIHQARAMVLVEGVSDQIAVEAAAVSRGRDLDVEGIVVVPIGGAHAIRRFLTTLRPPGPTLRLAALCDLREEGIFRRALAMPQVTAPGPPFDLEYVGLFVCVDDLEDELVRAVGAARVEALFESQADLTSYRSLQTQPAWRGRDPQAQMRRFLGSGSGRKLRYARLLVEEAAVRAALPPPLDALLETV